MPCKRISGWIALVLLAATPAAAQGVNPASDGPVGFWLNPKRTVKVATGPCGDRLCGWVVWADAKAIADAGESGVQNLVGTELLRSYRRTAPGQWRGEVYVPDMGQIFTSKIAEIDRNTLKISGCILGGLLCRSQIWQRG